MGEFKIWFDDGERLLQVVTLGGDWLSVLGVTSLGSNGALVMSCVVVFVCDIV
jgi:hypothetical protein